MTVAELIKKTRTDENMTQEEYGLKFGITRQTVSSWENGRSIPDLQMLIDICNTYQVSLDKLLNENEEFVNKIDFRVRIVKSLKYIAGIVMLALVVFGIVVIRWEVKAAEMNEKFAVNAKQAGFVIEDGIYAQEIEGVLYSLPNQTLPFLRDDFFVKYAYAQDESKETEIEIIFPKHNIATIELDHDKTIEVAVKTNGDFEVDIAKLNKEEAELYKETEVQVQKMVKQLKKFYDAVY